MQLYGSDLSPFVIRVVMLANAKGLTLEREAPPGGPKGPDYLKINPIGKVPALVHDGLELAESEVICEYLEDLYLEPTLRPANAAERAGARLIARIVDLYLSPPLTALFAHLSPENRDQEIVDAAIADVSKSLGFIEAFLSGKDFAAGAQMSGGDCALVPVLFFVDRLLPMFDIENPLGHHPKLQPYWQRMQSVPAASEALSAMDAALAAYHQR